MKKDYLRNTATWRLLWMRMKLHWPVLIWVGALLGFIVLFATSNTSSSVRGVVDVVRESAAPLETARLRAIHVNVGNPVKAGDLLASMDTTLIDSEMQYRQTQLAMDGLHIERQFTRAVDDAERDLQLATFNMTTLEVELQSVQQELKRLDKRLSNRLISEETVSPWRVRELTLQRELNQYPDRIRLLEQQLAAARTLRQQMQAHFSATNNPESEATDEVALSPEAKRNGLDILKMRREDYFIRATQDGVVSRIEKEPGEVVQAGESILSLVAKGTQRIVAFVPETEAHAIQTGQAVTISRSSGEAPKVPGIVLALGPEIQFIPDNINPVPGQLIRGRRVVLEPQEPDVFLPGEAVSIKRRSTLWQRMRIAERPADAETKHKHDLALAK